MFTSTYNCSSIFTKQEHFHKLGALQGVPPSNTPSQAAINRLEAQLRRPLFTDEIQSMVLAEVDPKPNEEKFIFKEEFEDYSASLSTFYNCCNEDEDIINANNVLGVGYGPITWRQTNKITFPVKVRRKYTFHFTLDDDALMAARAPYAFIEEQKRLSPLLIGGTDAQKAQVRAALRWMRDLIGARKWRQFFLYIRKPQYIQKKGKLITVNSIMENGEEIAYIYTGNRTITAQYFCTETPPDPRTDCCKKQGSSSSIGSLSFLSSEDFIDIVSNIYGEKYIEEHPDFLEFINN